jgi:hypothetical protein
VDIVGVVAAYLEERVNVGVTFLLSAEVREVNLRVPVRQKEILKMRIHYRFSGV